MTLKRIIRIATKDDRKKHELNLNEEKKAMKECEKLIKKYNLNMKVIDANFTFDKEQLMYHFLSDSRIDFRNLAKELAGIFKTRIELRQIGVRDKAKEIGGIGPCGRTLCCTDYLVNFDSVSINMAKNQNLSLNPNKINGPCGRLLCCLTYDQLGWDGIEIGYILEEGSKEEFNRSLKKAEKYLKIFDKDFGTDFTNKAMIYSVCMQD